MVPLPQLAPSETGQYCCLSHLNLFDAPDCQTLATQAAPGRYLRILQPELVKKAICEAEHSSIAVSLCEDGYTAWLPLEKISQLEPAATVYQAIILNRTQIEDCLPQVIQFAFSAMLQPNYYLWGGTTAPNYDCSGLVQTAFASVGIWLPRDSYQQEAFTERIAIEQLLPGDLIFFGQERVNHVALSLGQGYYIHSSGQEMGRNGIGIDRLSQQGDPISRAYYQQFWSCGRVMRSFP